MNTARQQPKALKFPDIRIYAKFSRVDAGKTPKYKMCKAVGFFEPFNALVGRDGNISLNLIEKPATSSEDAPTIRLQGKNSINITGLKNYFVGGCFSGFAYGNPPSADTFGGKKQLQNPFAPEYRGDAFLFRFDDLQTVDLGGIKQEIPSGFEMLVLANGKPLASAYCASLAKGGFDAVINQLKAVL